MQDFDMNKTCKLLRFVPIATGLLIVACTVQENPKQTKFADAEPTLDSTIEVDAGPPTQLACVGRDRCAGEYCDQVLIPAGEFRRGTGQAPRTDSHFESGDGRPSHRVQLDAFCIDKYEVTLQRYEACVDDGVCSPQGLNDDDGKLYAEDPPYQTTVNHYAPWCSPDRRECKHYAVNGKNYWQAQAYCAWVGGRLCTEAEWERAANGPGPGRRKHPWGDQAPTTELANFRNIGSGFIEPVDSHPNGASAEGVFNLAGNAYEWVRDAYAIYSPAPNDGVIENPISLPTKATDRIIGRGSCFFTEPGDTVTERSVWEMDFDWG
jgi:formylglycine-generating enzyme required for sulfatase activity